MRQIAVLRVGQQKWKTKHTLHSSNSQIPVSVFFQYYIILQSKRIAESTDIDGQCIDSASKRQLHTLQKIAAGSKLASHLKNVYRGCLVMDRILEARTVLSPLIIILPSNQNIITISIYQHTSF